MHKAINYARDNRILVLFLFLCFLACIDLARQYALNSHNYWFYLYARGVQSRSDLWEIGYHLEEMEHKINSQQEFFDVVESTFNGFNKDLRGMSSLMHPMDRKFLQWREARAKIQHMLHNESSIYQIRCEESGPFLRVGVNDFRTDPRDVCDIFTGPSMSMVKSTGGPDTMFEKVFTGNDGEFYLRSISSDRFLTVDRKQDNYEWKLIVGGPVAGAAEKFRITPDGLLFSSLIKGGFVCSPGKATLGYAGPYQNFNKFIFTEVDDGRIKEAWELVDLSNQVHDILANSLKQQEKSQQKQKQNANAAISSDAKGHTQEHVKICMAVPMTSKGTEMQAVADSPFFPNLFDSFMKSIDWRSNRFEFSFYLGFDKADLLYDTGDAWSEMRSEFQKRATFHMKEQMLDDDAIRSIMKTKLSIKLMHFEHLEGSPTQVVSNLVLKAYSDGFDYFYQVNDDTSLVTPNWAPSLIKSLAGNPLVSNFGVTGPLDGNNDLIFTHAFVHRTHIDVFGHMFPTSFKNWWSDDWITTVYGSAHTFKNPDVQIMHNVGSQKTSGATRYDIDQGAQIRLADELRKGHVQIDKWLRNMKLPRLPLPLICGYIPLVTHFASGVKSSLSQQGEDHEASADALDHISRPVFDSV